MYISYIIEQQQSHNCLMPYDSQPRERAIYQHGYDYYNYIHTLQFVCIKWGVIKHFGGLNISKYCMYVLLH